MDRGMQRIQNRQNNFETEFEGLIKLRSRLNGKLE